MKTIINTYFRLLITSLVQNIFKKNTILFSTTLFLLCFNISQAQTDIINEFSSENYSYSTVKNSTNNDGNSTYSIREILATSSDDELSSEIYNTLKKGKKAFSKDIKQIVTTPSFHSIVKEKFLSLISTQKQSFKNIFTHLSTIFVDSDGDGIDDTLDLDDDNDGILDGIENFSIASLSPELWLDAADATSITSDATNLVSQWSDKSGNNNHVNQPTSEYQPTKGTDKISFDGLNDNMVASSAINNSNINIYYVRKQPSSSSIDFRGGNFAICSDDGSTSGINSGFGSPTYYINGTSQSPNNRDQMHELINTDNKMMLSVVGGNMASWSSFGLSTYSGKWRFDGEFYEIILVDGSTIDTETQQKIEGYLAHKWDLVAELPSNHPYKSSPVINDTDSDGTPNSLDLDSDGDGCPDAIEGDASFTNSDLIDSMLIGEVDSNGIPNKAIGGQGIGIAAIQNPVLDETANQNLVVNDIIYTTGNAVFTITNALANITYELVDLTGQSLSPQVIATQGTSTSDLELTILIENIPIGNTVTQYQVIAGIPSTCRVPLTKQPTLTSINNRLLITQVYQNGTERFIELTNISDISLPGNLLNVNLFIDKSGNLSDITPDESYNISDEIAPNQSIIIGNSSNLITNIHPSSISVTNNAITNFNGGNDIIILSSSADGTSWANRTDVIESITDNSSSVRVDESDSSNSSYNHSNWITFIDDNLDPYEELANGGPKRHPHAPLISEVENATNDSNIQLGYHRIQETSRKASSWSNGVPDRSRRVIINEDYIHSDSSLSARQLNINNNAILSIGDQPLIVSENITIETGSEIRLIGTSQLISTHSSISKVSGRGKLHVDQNSEVASTYRYNYLSSPVNTIGQSTFTLANVIKDGTIPTSNSSQPSDIKFITEYNGSATSPISISERWLYTYDSSTLWREINSTTTISETDGFTFKGPGQEQNYTFVGTPKDGNLTTNIAAGGYYLVGNPYASAIRAKKFIEDNLDATTATLYFWDNYGEDPTNHENADDYGGYATINASMSVASIEGDLVPGDYIAIAQGFFIIGSPDGGNIVFNNSQREYKIEGDDSILFRDTEQDTQNMLPIFKLGLEYTTNEYFSLNRQIGISFQENNSFSYDKGYDSAIFDLHPTDIFWKFPGDDTKYVIAGVQELSIDLEIPLGLKIELDGEVLIRLDEQQHIDENIYLKDNLTGITQKLTDNEQGIRLLLSSGTYLERFTIVFSESSLNIANHNLVNNDVSVYTDHLSNELILENNLNLSIKKVVVYNILGQSIKTWDNLGKDLEIRLKTIVPKAIYIVKIDTENGQTIKKIHIN
tara:strand:+ start:1066 stop:5022 length:3957 start_codon:yes stop_codon:yes gene_type:complete